MSLRSDMLTEQDAREVIGCTAYTDDGDKIGKVGQLFLDDETGRPEFVTVNTGLFGTNESFVPVAEATFNGGRLTVPFTKDKVKDAPNVDAEGGHLDQPEEQRLYEYYGLTYGGLSAGDTDGRTSGDPTGDATGERTGDVSGRMADAGTSWTAGGSAGAAGAEGGMTEAEGVSGGRAGTAGTRGHEDDRTGVDPSDVGTAGSAADTAGTERTTGTTAGTAGTTSEQTGRARLRKYVTTEEEAHRPRPQGEGGPEA
jgi:sporulation protein YlmC with PRC-barrel domain